MKYVKLCCIGVAFLCLFGNLGRGAEEFQFGIEYGVPGLAKTFSKTGAHVVKPTPALVIWKRVQPAKNSPYHWSDIDRHVAEYQEAGFDTIQLLITAESPWASRGSGFLVRDTRPKPEHEADYVRFVKAVVERYDKDGIDDMPGLRYPIHQWGIEREFTGFFPGSAKEYVELLKLAYPAIKEADPNAKVLLVALLMWDIFQGHPSDLEITSRLQSPPGGRRKDIAGIPALLDAFRYFDIVDFHSLGDYSEIEPTVRWIRNELNKRGAPNKPIYIGDAFPMSPLLGYGFETCKRIAPASAKEIFPVTSGSRCDASKLIAASRKRLNPQYRRSHAWIEERIAIGLVRKFVTAASEGLMGINVGNLEDWPIPFGAGISQFMGMVDTKASLGDQIKVARTAGEPRPAFDALKMVIQKLDGFDRAERLKVWGDENIHVYQLMNRGKRILVVWYDDGRFYGLRQVTPEKNITLLWDSPSALVTGVPTKRNQEKSKEETISAVNGKITITVGDVPIFVEP